MSDPVTTVTWKPSGPYIIEGPVVIRNNEGEELKGGNEAEVT